MSLARGTAICWTPTGMNIQNITELTNGSSFNLAGVGAMSFRTKDPRKFSTVSCSIKTARCGPSTTTTPRVQHAQEPGTNCSIYHNFSSGMDGVAPRSGLISETTTLHLFDKMGRKVYHFRQRQWAGQLLYRKFFDLKGERTSKIRSIVQLFRIASSVLRTTTSWYLVQLFRTCSSSLIESINGFLEAFQEEGVIFRLHTDGSMLFTRLWSRCPIAVVTEGNCSRRSSQRSSIWYWYFQSTLPPEELSRVLSGGIGAVEDISGVGDLSRKRNRKKLCRSRRYGAPGSRLRSFFNNWRSGCFSTAWLPEGNCSIF